MNGAHLTGSNNRKADLLPHRYRPDCTDEFMCNSEQASRLKHWIQEFISLSNGHGRHSSHSDYDDNSSGSDMSDILVVAKKCVLLTGPPGIGKTSLVYTIANELKLHVVESHPAEKRDSKLFSMLKLTNQKGKINAIAKLFHNAKQQQQQQQQSARRKRRKLVDSSVTNQSQRLSLSGDTSIILFDDVDVVFEEDGPFFKSLVEFIKESKRPVVLTATQSIDQIKNLLINYEHIHLNKHIVENCTKLLRDICKREKYHKLSKLSRCETIANHLDCDIRQCLNRIHFYGDQADQLLDINLDSDYIQPEFSRLKLGKSDIDNKSILNCYSNSSLVDLMDNRFNLADRSTLLERWMDGKPSFRNEEHKFEHDLGEQIKESIVGLTKNLYSNELMINEDSSQHRRNFKNKRNVVVDTSRKINEKIKSRIEPPEKEFSIDIVPLFGEIIKLESQKRETNQINGGSSRRSRRMLSYLESIPVYLDPEDIKIISETLLTI